MRAVRVDDERWERAKAAADEKGISVAELIRRGIDHMTKPRPRRGGGP